MSNKHKIAIVGEPLPGMMERLMKLVDEHEIEILSLLKQANEQRSIGVAAPIEILPVEQFNMLFQPPMTRAERRKLARKKK